MSNHASNETQEPAPDSVEVLESYVVESCVHEIVNNPTNAVIAEG